MPWLLLLNAGRFPLIDPQDPPEPLIVRIQLLNGQPACPHRRFAAAVLCTALALTLSGCGGDAGNAKASPRVNAAGKAEVDGKPIPAGTVTFLHIETGNMAVCTIEDGAYASESDQGPNPGINTVTIDARETQDGNPMWATSYSEQNIQVADGADFTKDFNVTGSNMKPFDPKSVQVDN